MRSKFITDSQDAYDNYFSAIENWVFTPFSPPADQGARHAPVNGSIEVPPTPALTSEAVQSSGAQSGTATVVALTSSGITINLLFDTAAMAAPAAFRAGIQQAAAIISAVISDKITVNIKIDYSGTGGGAAAGPDGGFYESYSTVRANLINNATPGDTTFNALPSGTSIQGQSSVAVWNAQLKLWGFLGANDTTTDDGSATFATDISSDLLVGVALHELTHAMGRIPYGTPYSTSPDIFDFYRFSSPGVRVFNGASTASPADFSVDGGNTKLADYGQFSDPSDFLNSGVQGPNDPFNEFYSSGTSQTLSTVDREQLDALGFHLASVVPQPTMTVQGNPAATAGQQISLSSLVSIVDPSHVGYQKLELWDCNGTVATGEFVVNGVAQTGGHEIDVAPADVTKTVFDVGTSGGTDLLYAQLMLNDGTLSGWKAFTVKAASVPQPSIAVQDNPAATAGQQISLSSLVSIADPSHVGYQKLELWDCNGTVATGEFVVNGVAQTGGHEIDVAPADVTKTVFDVGTSGGTDLLYAQLMLNDGTLSGWKAFTVKAASVPQPSIAVQGNPAATAGQQISLSSLVSIVDPSHVGYQKLELWDCNGTVATGEFVVNGVAQTGGHEIDVAPADVTNTVFDVGTSGGTDLLYAQLMLNDGTLSGWNAFTVKAASVPQPSIAVQSNPAATAGQQISLSSLVSIADPSHVGYQKLELWDCNGTAATGEFVVNGVAQTGGHEIDVAPADVTNTVFDVGASGGTDLLYAQLMLNDGTLSGWKAFTVRAASVPQPTAQVGSPSTPSVTATQDTFIFKPNFGEVTIANFDPAKDTIEISQSIFANMTALLAATRDDGAGNAVITDTAHDTITIQHVTAAQLLAHQGDFHFV